MESAASRFDVSTRSEAEDVRLAKAGNASVWASWHDEYYPILYRYAYARLGSVHDAEDIASQVFLEAWRGIKGYQERGRPVLAWLFGIARHLISRRRRQDRNGTAVSLDERAELEAGEGVDLDDRLALYEALRALKVEYREVLILRFLLDLPLKEVSDLIGKTEAATYSLQTRALTALRGVLQGTNDGRT